MEPDQRRCAELSLPNGVLVTGPSSLAPVDETVRQHQLPIERAHARDQIRELSATYAVPQREHRAHVDAKLTRH